MKLLVQASDFGFTRASVYGVIDSIELGLVRERGIIYQYAGQPVGRGHDSKPASGMPGNGF